MQETITTERLRLRRWEQDDIRLLSKLSATPAVVRYIGDGSVWSDARVAQVAAHNVEHWERHDFGWRVATAVDGGAPIGFIALSFAGEGAGVDADEYEIGWWLAPEAWGRGFAREGALAVRDEGFARIGARSVVARIAPPNDRSLAVAAAIGLEIERDGVGRRGEPIKVLRLTRERWSQPSAA